MPTLIETWFVTFALILARVSAFVATVPYLGGRTVPRTIKLSVALILSAFWFGLGWGASAESATAINRAPWLALVLAVGREAIVGAILGYAFGLFLVPMRIAGEYVGQEMGLTLGAISDPTRPHMNTVIGELFEVFGVLLFFSQDVHLTFLALLNQTFAAQPLGGSFVPIPINQQLIALTSATQWGLTLAAPIAFCLFVTSLVLALLTRVAPQLNLMSAGFALRVLAGLLAMLVFWPEIAPWMNVVLQRMSGLLG